MWPVSRRAPAGLATGGGYLLARGESAAAGRSKVVEQPHLRVFVLGAVAAARAELQRLVELPQRAHLAQLGVRRDGLGPARRPQWAGLFGGRGAAQRRSHRGRLPLAAAEGPRNGSPT
ncbi:hypothetical protein FGB62_102g04 [Gracilaria domingensis]|nr:hypothetical protein FGB62_102g04 [Gracilaria domingensis]